MKKTRTKFLILKNPIRRPKFVGGGLEFSDIVLTLGHLGHSVF